MQRLPDPGLTPTSQEAGGMVHSQALAMTAPGTPPGFDGASMAYPVSTDSAQPPGQSGATIPIPTDPVGAQARDGGRRTGDMTGPSPWVKTGTAS